MGQRSGTVVFFYPGRGPAQTVGSQNSTRKPELNTGDRLSNVLENQGSDFVSEVVLLEDICTTICETMEKHFRMKP